MANGFSDPFDSFPSPLIDEDPFLNQILNPLFYSPEHEAEMFAAYMPKDEAACDEFALPCSHESSPSEGVDFEVVVNADSDSYAQSMSPSPSPASSPVDVKPLPMRSTRRPLRYAETPGLVPDGEVRKRGRPAGCKSNSKMATYSKQYREMKKHETKILAQQVSVLSEQRRHLEMENARLADRVRKLKQENQNLRQKDVQSQKLAALISALQENEGRLRLSIRNGEPILEVV